MRGKKLEFTFASFGILALISWAEALTLPNEPGTAYYGHAYTGSDHHHYDHGDHEHQHDGPGALGTFGNSDLSHGNCHLPESWKGKWFQRGLNQHSISIDGKSIGTKGVCIESSADKFLFYDVATNCHKCLVINERHRNVLQYKESPDCDKDLLENLCSSINGDAQLYSLFRIEATPEECPFRGAPFNFTYNRGHGECRDPVSRVDACTENSRLLLRFEACPNVDKTESKSEELECLAQWKDGSNHYLMGKLDSHMGSSNFEDKFRCFMLEKIKDHSRLEPNGHAPTIGYRVAQSGDASCSGINSPTDGARALTLMKVEQDTQGKCKFPKWVSAHHWHTLDGKISVRMHHHKNTTLHISEEKMRNSSMYNNMGLHSSGGYSAFGTRTGFPFFNGGTRIICQSSVEVSNSHFSIVAHHTEGCKSETVCLNIHKRVSHVIEMKITKKGDAECGTQIQPKSDEDDEEPEPSTYVTLVSATASSHRCPSLGKFMATGVSQDGRVVRDACGVGSQGAFNSLVVGCGERGTMEFHSKCATQEPITSYTCHGNWEEAGIGYLIASPLSRSSTTARRYCFTYTHAETGLRVSSSSESCRRNISPGVEGTWAFNLTVEGQCAERFTSGASLREFHSALFFSCISVILLMSLPRAMLSQANWR